MMNQTDEQIKDCFIQKSFQRLITHKINRNDRFNRFPCMFYYMPQGPGEGSQVCSNLSSSVSVSSWHLLPGNPGMVNHNLSCVLSLQSHEMCHTVTETPEEVKKEAH